MRDEHVGLLYVDDEEHNLTAFRAAFRRDYQVFTSTHPREAIQILREHDIPIIITDQRMPEMMGVQFLEAILPEFPDSVRMILTGFSDIDAVIRAINTGSVYRYVTKPWDEREMRMVLNGAADLVRLRRQQAQLMLELHERVAEQERVMQVFQKYVPASVVSEVVSRHAGESLLDGESRIVSVMVVDIRGFTTLAASMEPKNVVHLLNDYFSVMSDCVRRHQGSVNKFLGDGLLALFGAPISHLENQANAVLCALEMVERLEAFNRSHEDVLGDGLRIGIGINTGEAVVGNIGSEDRIEYTVIGDVVNVAARLEDLTREVPNSILVSRSTYHAVEDLVSVNEWGERTVRGRPEGLSVYEVTGRRQG